jgi:N-acetylglucosaminyl-diphospho-decaprenol L-rhamnosyltransferase
LTPASGVPDLTAIVVAHDVREEVLQCLASLEDHRGDLSLQVIVVDNASADGTLEAVRDRHPEVEVLRLGHNAGMVARNAGLEHARGRLQMFIDSDAAVTAGALQTLASVFDEHPRIGLAGPRLVYRDGSLQLSARRYPPLLLPVLRRPPLGRWLESGSVVREHLMADEPHDARRRVEYVLGACQVFRAEAAAAVGGTDRRIWYGHDDADWCFAMRTAGWEVAYIPDAVVTHDYRRSSAANPVSTRSLRQLQAHLYFQVKWARQRRRLKREGRAMDAEAAAGSALRRLRAATELPTSN